MKKYFYTIAIFIFLPVIVYADWQADLEGYFDYVTTFDNDPDWGSCIDTGGNDWEIIKEDGDSMPDPLITEMKLVCDSRCTEKTDKVIDSRSAPYTWQNKNLALSVNEANRVYRFKSYIGDGTPTSGYPQDSSVYVFWMMKFYKKVIDISSSTGTYYWQSAGSNHDYYLTYDGGNPNLAFPNTLIINGEYTPSATVRGTIYSVSSAWSHLDDGSSGPGTALTGTSWNYRDTNGLGYKTISVHMSDNSDPNNATISYHTGFIVKTDANTYGGNGSAHKWLMPQAGFYRTQCDGSCGGVPNCSGSAAWGQHADDPTKTYACQENIACDYGINGPSVVFSCGAGGDTSQRCGFPVQENWGVWDSTCWSYGGGNVSMYYDLGYTIGTLFENDQWFGVEYRYKLGSNPGEGELEEWVYDASGNTLAHGLLTGMHYKGAGTPVEGVNRFEFGGNTGGNGYYYNVGSSMSDEWYMDDLIIDGDFGCDISSAHGCIGPTYFSLLNGTADMTAPGNPVNLEVK